MSEGENIEAYHRLSPNFLKSHSIKSVSGAKTFDAVDLVRPERFDLLAKYAYAKARLEGRECGFYTEMYLEHLRVFNGLEERDGSGKSGADAFLQSFNQVIDSVANGGLDAGKSMVPVSEQNVIGDGAHRVAAALAAKTQVPAIVFESIRHNFDFRYFERKGLSQEYLDSMALELLSLVPGLYVLVLYPAADGREEEVRSLIENAGSIYYRKEVELSEVGGFNFVRQVYRDQDWVGSWEDDFRRARKKASKCFKGNSPLRCYVFSASKLADVRRLKADVRELYGVKNHSVHISDTSAEALDLGRLLFNRNSVNHMNTSEYRYFPVFTTLFEKYCLWLSRGGHDVDAFCVDGSATLAVYGLREARDVDFIHSGSDAIETGLRGVDDHNEELKYHTSKRDDLIYDPNKHFWYFGAKFVSLEVLRQMKLKRGEEKDSRDVALIDAVCPVETFNSVSRLERIRRGYQVWRQKRKLQRRARRKPDQPVAPKIVGLVPARNEAVRIRFCLEALSKITDAIVFLDDCSDDDTVGVVEQCAESCRVQKIICKSSWYRDEPGDRNLLLNAGRAIGGTHFVVIDADELFTSNCVDEDYLRKWILTLKPKEQLSLHWVQLWRSVDVYRNDASKLSQRYKRCIFCDDGKSSYRSKFIHTSRIPKMKGRVYKLEGLNVGLLHFQYVNWDNLLLKQRWYCYLEKVRQPKKPAQAIVDKYAVSVDESELIVTPCPAEWFGGYSDFSADMYAVPDEWRLEQISDWIADKGEQYFIGLD